MFRLLCLVALLALFFLEVGALVPQSFFPASVPLAVRSPYLSSWQNTTIGQDVLAQFAQVSQPSGANLGWLGLVKVDSTTYLWMGESGDLAVTGNLSSIQVTPTRTIYNVQAGPVDVTVTFLTPIESSDWVRQSMPFSYLAVNVSSNDGKEHTVQLYSDITAEWVAGNRDATVEWSTTTSATSVYHQASLQQPSPFTEVNNQAEDATAYFAMASVLSLAYQTGGYKTVRGQFSQQGSLTNDQDTDFRAISDNWPVFAISVDLGSIQTMTSPVVWAVGVVRDPSIQYTTGMGEIQLRSPYYATQYSSIGDIIDAFLVDYESAMTRSTEVDSQLTAAASAVSSNYNNLVTLAARQTLGGIDITVANGTDGNWNTSDVMIFMKNIGSIDGRVNPVEVLYAAFPMFLYLNASFGQALLAPLLEFQDSPLYTLPYAASDLGQSYPVASGDNTSSPEGVEQCGNMLIMALAHARASGDGSLISQHYELLKNWTNYLVENSLTPTNQYSADGQSTTNMTNLAIKGIIGIKAMSEISRALGNTDDAEQFSTTASAYANTWQSLSLSSAQQGLLFAYGEEDTWALMYNLYADRLLQTNVVDESVYNAQEEYYMKLADSSGAFGLPIDSASSGEVNSAWLAFTAASVSNTTVRNILLNMISAHAASNQTPGVFPTTYSASTGVATSGYASPAQGAMFAPLALSIANQTIKSPTTSSGSTGPESTGTGVSGKHVDVGAIVGGVVGGLAALALVFLSIFFFWRRRRQNLEKTRRLEADKVLEECVEPEPFPFETSPAFPAQSIGTDSESTQRPLLMSSKVREYLSLRSQEQAVLAPESHVETMESASSGAPPSTATNGALSPNEIFSLRTEMENLRRAMQELHPENLQAPPEYAYEG